MLPHNSRLAENAKQLRGNMTAQEKHLWYDLLKRLPVTVKRQHIINNYIVDFYIPQNNMVIEVDGLQHRSPEMKAEDAKRDAELARLGISVVRYSNKDINENFRNVTADLLSRLEIDPADVTGCNEAGEAE